MAVPGVSIQLQNFEYRTFREHYDRLGDAISNPEKTAGTLYAKNLLTKEEKEKVMHRYLHRHEKIEIIMSAMERRIEIDRANFFSFLNALTKQTKSEVVAAKKALETYRKFVWVIARYGELCFYSLSWYWVV